MASLIETYERHLKKKAEAAAPAQRLRVTYSVMFPWVLAAVAPSLLVTVFHLPRSLETWIIVPTGCLAAAGAFYAGWRVAMYGWQFDRTPATAGWTETPAGQALIQALRRVTLNGLSGLTPATRLQADLKLTSADISSLLDILARERWLDARSIDGKALAGLTVDALLRAMSPS